KFLQRTIPESIHISLDITPDPSGYLVEADPAQIRQVIMNLALNSRDAMPQGGELLIRLSRLTIKSANERPVADLPPGEWLQLSLSDTGTGISKETMQHIFEPFFTTKDVGRGTGLGMAQVYGIIKQHNGSVDVKSTEGQGAAVSIFLPVFEQSVEEPEIETDPEIHRGKGETIMLVEDERELLALGVQMIESLGYAVIPAANGNQALSVYKARSSTIALVITDMVMPDIGGLELLRELAIINPRLKAIVLSGYSLEEDENKLYSRGIVDQIQKPVNIAQMARSIHQAIKNSGTEQPCCPQQGEPLV
ncbi:MAG: ATP-binding protein, partial [Syntrophobacteraceae bacterium]